MQGVRRCPVLLLSRGNLSSRGMCSGDQRLLRPSANPATWSLLGQWSRHKAQASSGSYSTEACKSLSHKNLEELEERVDRGIINYKKQWKTCELTEAEVEDALNKLTERETRILKLIKAEYEFWCVDFAGVRVPKTVTNKMWLEMVQNFRIDNNSGRSRKWLHWFKMSETKEMRKELHELENTLPEGGGTLPLFTVLSKESFSCHYHNNLFHAMMFGRTLVFDFDYEHLMGESDIRQLSRQLGYCHGGNKVSPEPFHFHLCNLRPDSFTHKVLPRYFKRNSSSDKPATVDDIPYTVTRKSYLDFYPKKKLVMLAPNGHLTVPNFDPECVYIIPALTKNGFERADPGAKAKREGIRRMRLPVQLMRERKASRAMPLHHIFDIICTKNKGMNWRSTLEACLPKKETRQESKKFVRDIKGHGIFD